MSARPVLTRFAFTAAIAEVLHSVRSGAESGGTAIAYFHWRVGLRSFS